MGGRGSGTGGVGGTGVAPDLQAVWDKEEQQLNDLLKKQQGSVDIEGVQYEKYTMKEMKSLWKDFRDYGVVDDQAVAILYKDGKIDYFSGEDFEPTQGMNQIDSVIYSGDWGYSVAGKNIKWENYQEGNVASDLARANKEIKLHNNRVEKGYEKGGKKKLKKQMSLKDYGDLHSDWRPDFKEIYKSNVNGYKLW